MTIQQFIKKAMKGGYVKNAVYVELKPGGWAFFPKGKYSKYIVVKPIEQIILDPKAWQAVGKVEGWKEDNRAVFFGNEFPDLSERYEGSAYVIGTWKHFMKEMIDALVGGKTIKQFLETL